MKTIWRAKINSLADCRARVLEALTPRDANPTKKYALGAFLVECGSAILIRIPSPNLNTIFRF
jgi:hypothetical protein